MRGIVGEVRGRDGEGEGLRERGMEREREGRGTSALVALFATHGMDLFDPPAHAWEDASKHKTGVAEETVEGRREWRPCVAPHHATTA